MNHNKNTVNIYYLNRSIIFKDHFWQKIELRLLMITKQLYCAAKKNNLIYINYLQNYLVNCVETKILLIKKVIFHFLYHCDCTKQMKFYLKHIDQINLLLYLSNNKLTLCKVSKLVVQKVKEYLLYIVTQPIWHARLSVNFTMFIATFKSDHISIYLTNKDNKFLLHQIIIQKFCSYSNFNHRVITFLYSNIYLIIYKKFDQVLNHVIYNIKSLNIINYNLNIFDNLCNYLMFNDINWYIFSNIKNTNLLNKINKNLLKHKLVSLQVSPLKIFYILIRQLLYRKSLNGFRIINTFNLSNSVIHFVISLYQTYYSNLSVSISINLQQQCNLLVNCYLNTWTKKHLSNNFIYLHYPNSLKIKNKLLNQLSYLFNLISFYSHLFW